MKATPIQMYYIRLDNQYEGPYTLDELKQLDLKRSTYVWRKGIPDWTKAGDLEEFHFLPEEKIEPVPDSNAKSDSPKTRFRLWVILFVIVSIFTLALVYRLIVN